MWTAEADGPAPELLRDCIGDHLVIPDPYWRAPLPSWLEGVSLDREAIPPDLRRAVMERDGYTCRWCGSTSRLQLDHITPVSAAGGNWHVNLRVLCAPCNGRRGNALSDRRIAHVLPIADWCTECTDVPSGALRRPVATYCTTCGSGGLSEQTGWLYGRTIAPPFEGESA